ncbi:MAG TPA: glycosyltransferase [Gammaproteobacteria bacterium]|nr:glycosyltransferase [Gammaproteobacteria bacterium]
MTFNPCAVIPVFNHHACLGRIAAAMAAHALPVIFVDDGSDAATKRTLAELAAADPNVEYLTLPHNQGKGAACLAGMAHAAERGFTHALQVDADGQHDLDDVAKLLALAAAHPDYLISGEPRYDKSVPPVRFYCRYLTHGFIWLATLSFRLHDSMCGFRVYPLASSLALARRVRIGRYMDFDTEIMARLYFAGTETLFIPTRVRYPADGISHYRMFADNTRMTWLIVRLLFSLPLRAPRLLYRNVTRARHWARIAEGGTLTGLRLVALLDRTLGDAVVQVLLYPITAWYFATSSRARRASRQFLAAAGVTPTLANRFRHFMQYSRAIRDKFRAWYAPGRITIDASECGPLLDAAAEGRGLLLLTAHMGNAEVARALAGRVPGLRINALVHTRNARKIDALLTEASGDYPLDLLEVTDFGPDTVLLLREKVARGETVVIVGDRTPVGGDGAVAQVDFLGHPAPFAIGPYVLAHVLECPVYLFLCLREGRGYKVHLEPFAERIRLPRDGRSAGAAGWAERYARRLADYARRYPLQWYNFHDIWRDGTPASRPQTARRRRRRDPALQRNS